MDEIKISKAMTKKAEKKQHKSQIVAQKETGIICSTFPTKNLMICNAGLSNGLTEETVYENFIKHGYLENIVMLPGKSTCFVTYTTTESAENAYNQINGKLKIAQDEKPVYLAYTNEVPNTTLNFQTEVPGLIIIKDIINEIEEETLLQMHDFNEENENVMKHRLVKHYGYEFRYNINNVDKDKPLKDSIPKECDYLWERLKDEGINFKPDQLTINFYKPGQGIPPHVDTHSAFEDPLVSFSLGSDVVMDFRHKDCRHCPVLLPRRSVAVMSGEARFDWTHGITPRKLDVVPTVSGQTVSKRGARVSFTFRKVRSGECDCVYTDNCDSFQKKKFGEFEEVAVKLEEMHVHKVYESIADHFSDTRHKPWPNVLDFVKSFEKGSILMDIGCGNGKYLGHNKDIFDIGCDTSFGLTNVCQERGFNVLNANCLKVPFKDNTADGLISIAVIHHLSTETRRKNAIKEMIRVLKPGGRALIYVWAKDQCKNDKSSYIKQDRKNRKIESSVTTEMTKNIEIDNNISLPVHTNRKQFQHQDLLVPWKLKKENKIESEYFRYYHVFEEGELEALCFENVEILKSYYDQGNWCVIFEKAR